MEENYFDQLHSVFPFVAALVGIAVGEQHPHSKTVVLFKLPELQQLLKRITSKHVLALLSANKIQRRIQNPETNLRDMFDSYLETGLYTLRAHLPDHIIEDLDFFG